MILAIIDKIPLYSTVREAVSWGRRNSINNYHTHTHKGRLGYMAGSSHGMFAKVPKPPSNTITPPIVNVVNNTTTNTTTNTNTNTGGGY
jgi:hypothetical protein|tara:strand:- start:114 stop:380 length:267 start_codon:yes stop_codon:yes gene_type:complete